MATKGARLTLGAAGKAGKVALAPRPLPFPRRQMCYAGKSARGRPSGGCLAASCGDGEVETWGEGDARGVGRRQLGSFSLCFLGASLFEGPGLGRSSLVRAEEAVASTLPKSYVKLAREIEKTLRSTIELEVEGASDAEIRRSGEPVKSLYRELLGKYDADARVSGDASYVALTGAFLELGNFYRAKGPQAHLTNAVRESVLDRLDAVQEALPPPKKK